MINIKLKYRNTGFMRQIFVWVQFRGKWRYKGVEFNRRYFRVYELTDEGVLPRFRDMYGATKNRTHPKATPTPRKAKS